MLLVATTRELRDAQLLRRGRTQPPDLLGLLDLVALATVCDVVPLKGLNRAFVAKGLQAMRQRHNVGLRALADAAALAVAPTTYHLGFVLGPRINAGGRIGDAALGARLLSTDDETEAARIAVLLDKLNRERKAIEKQMLDEAMAHADTLVEADPAPAVADRRLRRLAQGRRRAGRQPARREVSAPSLRHRLGRRTKAQARCARSPASTSARRCGRPSPPDICVKGGGHAMAAGLTVSRDHLDGLRAFFARAA